MSFSNIQGTNEGYYTRSRKPSLTHSWEYSNNNNYNKPESKPKTII